MSRSQHFFAGTSGDFSKHRVPALSFNFLENCEMIGSENREVRITLFYSHFKCWEKVIDYFLKVSIT